MARLDPFRDLPRLRRLHRKHLRDGHMIAARWLRRRILATEAAGPSADAYVDALRARIWPCDICGHRDQTVCRCYPLSPPRAASSSREDSESGN